VRFYQEAPQILVKYPVITGISQRMANNSMGKTQFTPADIDSLTVGDIVRFIKKSHRFSSSIQ